MAYVLPTPTSFKTRLPRFDAVDDALVQIALDEAARTVDQSWSETDYADAIIYLAAHLLTMDGLGGGAEAEVAAQGMGGFKVMKSGALTLERGSAAETPGAAGAGIYGATSYGIRFWQLAMRNRAGPISTGDPAALAINPNARDVSLLPGFATRWPGNG